MPQATLVGVLIREVRQGSPGELMVESSHSRERRPPCKQTWGCQMTLRPGPPLLTYLLMTRAISFFTRWNIWVLRVLWVAETFILQSCSCIGSYN